jgi:hypothetical protein
MASSTTAISWQPDITEDKIVPHISSFPFMRLPRELRNIVYDFHLENAHEESMLLDSTQSTDYRYRGHHIQEQIYPGFFRPIFLRDTEYNTSVGTHSYNESPVVEKAHELPMPELARLTKTQAGREAWDYYSNKLVVDVDAFAWLQIWCVKWLEPLRFAGLHKLYVEARSWYCAPPCLDRYEFFYDDLYPSFLLHISNDGQEFVICSRFRLKPNQLAILQANMNALLAQSFPGESNLNGEVVLEAVLALCTTKTHK